MSILKELDKNVSDIMLLSEKGTHSKALADKKVKRISAEDLPGSELYGELDDGTTVWLVDGAYIRDNIDVCFVAGGNAEAYNYFAKKEIWLERSENEDDMKAILVHEAIEMIQMRFGLSYNRAHEMANSIEEIVRGNKKKIDKKQEKQNTES